MKEELKDEVGVKAVTGIEVGPGPEDEVGVKAVTGIVGPGPGARIHIEKTILNQVIMKFVSPLTVVIMTIEMKIIEILKIF